jgi:hypothetical protein
MPTDKISDVGGVLCIELDKIARYAKSLLDFGVVVHLGSLETSLERGLSSEAPGDIECCRRNRD